MNKCNIFKPLSSPTGEFLMFSQYTEDLTRQESNKSSYRVIPSKFIVMNLNINDFDDETNNIEPSITKEDNVYSMSWGSGESVSGINNIIPQIFQSYYENSVSIARDMIANNENIDVFKDSSGNIIEYSTELLWACMHRFKMISAVEPQDNFYSFDEVKYIGDINIHSNRNIDAYNYDEILCYIPTDADEYFYPIISRGKVPFEVAHDQNIAGWTPVSYPQSYPLCIKNIVTQESGTEGYIVGDWVPDFNKTSVPIPRNVGLDGHLNENAEYNFNAIVVLYDILQSEPGEDPIYLHRYRPMGIYFTGPAETVQEVVDGEIVEKFRFSNTFTKYISNNDAYGQGSAFGLRIMTRYTSVPNNSTYSMTVTTESGDYEIIAASMGRIADAIVDINKMTRETINMSQAFKDHLAMFRNNRTNVPYPRLVNGEYYWFVNGRNTGQPCTMKIRVPQPGEVCVVNVETDGNGSISAETVNSRNILVVNNYRN